MFLDLKIKRRMSWHILLQDTKCKKEKLNDLIEVRGRVKLTRLSPSDLIMSKLGSVDPKFF